MENYDKTREIGKGSYGVVWLVKNKKDKKNYVLKRIDLRKSSDRDKKSAEQEARLLKSLKHPNIVSYKESFQIDGYLHIVMLFCDGGDLYTKIKEQNGVYIEETQIVEWFVQIAMAIQYMHEKNILHRDLKTQNIFLTKNKIIKVGDLGIARVLKSNNDMATTIIGTPYYMSPELFSNKPYNSKSDVWALGCCVYEMTTLKHAFNAKDMSSLVFKITKGKMPPIPNHYSRELIVLIESMLNSDPSKRPTTNKILRDPFIKKNIMLFLERTKQKQQQQQEKENKIEQDLKPKSLIQDQYVSNNQNKSEFVNNNEIIKVTPPQVVPKIKSRMPSDPNSPKNRNNSISDLDDKKDRPNRSDSEQKEIKKNFDSDFEEPKFNSDKNKKNIRTSRVRISSVVENIETKEHFSLAESSSQSDDLSDEEHKPYELTKPIKLLNIDESKQKIKPSSSEKILESENQYQPQIVERKPIIFENQPKIQQRIVSSSSPNRVKSNSLSANENESSGLEENNSELKQVQPNLSARERRRLKIRLSQNESNSVDSKPPLLKKYAIKSNQSEVFYNSNNKNNQSSAVSKSLNEQENNKKDNRNLQDSLKILRQNQASSNDHENKPIGVSKSSPSLISQQKKLERNPYFPQRPGSNNSSQSSSSSSIASSNDEHDPGKELIRLEKKKKKDKKEMDTFIDKLSSTLKAANNFSTKVDSEVEDIKDEILDDLEEEALQVEMSDLDQDNKYQNNTLKKSESYDFDYLKPKKVDITNHRDKNLRNSYDDEDDSTIKNYEIVKHRKNNKKDDEDFDLSKFGSVSTGNDTLGVTNHMYSRINSLEKECLEKIGREKLEQVFKILDSFKDDEIETGLISLIGRQVYKDYSGKLWLLKFCKETAKIGLR